MIEKIIDGISEALAEKFGDEYEIYTDVEQGLTEPCFLITCLNPTNGKFLGKRYFRTNPFMIQYFPKSTTETTLEYLRILDDLFDCLEFITVDGDLTMGTNMSGELVDYVLQFRVNYDMFMRKHEDEVDKMEDYSVNTDVRKE